MNKARDPDQPDLAALAKRFMDLWQEQMAAQAADPELAESIGRFMQAMPPGMPFWPGYGSGPARAASVGGASRQRGGGVDELASRLRAIEERLARLERGAPAKRRRAPAKSKKNRA